MRTVLCQTDSAQPITVDVGEQAERLVHPDTFGLPPQMNLSTCIQATRLQCESPGYLLAHISSAYRENLDHPLTQVERGNVQSILTMVAGVRRVQCQEILEAVRILEAHQILGIPNS